MDHTLKCLAQQAEMKRLHDEYENKWPHYCRKCKGAGETSWQENQAPLGSGEVWLETLADWCEDCISSGICPRCSHRPMASDGFLTPCPQCGWNFDGGCPPADLEEPCECYFPVGEF